MCDKMNDCLITGLLGHMNRMGVNVISDTCAFPAITNLLQNRPETKNTTKVWN